MAEQANYILLAVIAMIAYSAFVPLVSIATRSSSLPAPVVLIVTSVSLAVGALVFAGLTSGIQLAYFLAPAMTYGYAAGLAITVAIIAYFLALANGPASVVVPIFGLFIAGGSVLGIVFLDETLTLSKAIGLVLAVTGVILIANS